MMSRLALLLVLLLWPGWGWAANLTQAQYDAYAQDVKVVHASEFATAMANSDWQFITDAYNALQAPQYYVWRTTLSEGDIYEQKVVDDPPTQTTWNWATFKAQAVQERDAWVAMMHPGKINPSLDNTRANYNVIFGGQGASLNQQNFLLALSRRKARRIEALLVVGGSGNGSTATPSVLGYEGTVSYADTAHALAGVPLP